MSTALPPSEWKVVHLIATDDQGRNVLADIPREHTTLPGRVTFAPCYPVSASEAIIAARTASLLASARTALPRSSNAPPEPSPVARVVTTVWPHLSDDSEAQAARFILAETLLSMVSADLPTSTTDEQHRRTVSLLRRAVAGATMEGT